VSGRREYAGGTNNFEEINFSVNSGFIFNFQINKEKTEMAKNRRLSPNQIAEEKRYFSNLKNIAGYRSLKPEYEVAAIQTVVDELDAALAEEPQLMARLAQVRDSIAEKGTQLTEKNDGAAIQTAAQVGEDSPEYQSLGRKRKSERGTRRRSTNGGNNSATS
jgi:hypothetical protein